jgi:hypothetical protein
LRCRSHSAGNVALAGRLAAVRRRVVFTFVARAAGGVLVAMNDEHFFAGFVPVAALVEAGEGADGSDDGVSGGDDALGLFDEEAEGVAGVFKPLTEEAEGVSMAVENAAVAEVEFEGDGGRAVPVKDGFVNGVAFGVVADGAMGYVSLESAVGVEVGATSSRGEDPPTLLQRDRTLPVRQAGATSYWF